jgi:hypothetical protein
MGSSGSLCQTIKHLNRGQFYHDDPAAYKLFGLIRLLLVAVRRFRKPGEKRLSLESTNTVQNWIGTESNI